MLLQLAARACPRRPDRRARSTFARTIGSASISSRWFLTRLRLATCTMRKVSGSRRRPGRLIAAALECDRRQRNHCRGHAVRRRQSGHEVGADVHLARERARFGDRAPSASGALRSVCDRRNRDELAAVAGHDAGNPSRCAGARRQLSRRVGVEAVDQIERTVLVERARERALLRPPREPERRRRPAEIVDGETAKRIALRLRRDVSARTRGCRATAPAARRAPATTARPAPARSGEGRPGRRSRSSCRVRACGTRRRCVRRSPPSSGLDRTAPSPLPSGCRDPSSTLRRERGRSRSASPGVHRAPVSPAIARKDGMSVTTGTTPADIASINA